MANGDVIDEIKALVPLSTVIGRRTKMVRKGRSDFMALCPFHGEKTPSFHVMDDKGTYYCFGCGEKGDVLTFVQKTENLSFREALEKLAAEAGVELPERSEAARAESARRQTLHDVLEAACTWYEGQLKTQKGESARVYFDRRGLSEETIRRFRLGYAPGGGMDLHDALSARSFPEDLMVEAGLFRKGEDGRRSRDWFRDRVTFPIMDRRGKVIAFGARIMGEGEPKYLNSPETPLFHKGETLFNLDKAREPALKAGRVLVVEGYMDVIALAQAGLAEAVAPLGTALTETQIGILWRVAAEPILCFDGDKAGQRAAGRALERALPMLKPGHSLRFLTLPDSLDPDELIRRDGVAAMRTIIEAAIPLVAFLWGRELASADLSTPERFAAFEARLGDLIRDIADARVQGHYRDALRERLRGLKASRRAPAGGGGRSSFRREAGRPGARSGGWPREGPLAGASADLRASRLAQGGGNGADRLERLLLAVLITHPVLLGPLENEIYDLVFVDSALDNLREAILCLSLGKPDLDTSQLKDHLADMGLAESVALIERDPLIATVSFVLAETPRERAESGWFHVLGCYRRVTGLKIDLEEAQSRYLAAPSDAGIQQILAIRAEISRVEAQSAYIETD